MGGACRRAAGRAGSLAGGVWAAGRRAAGNMDGRGEGGRGEVDGGVGKGRGGGEPQEGKRWGERAQLYLMMLFICSLSPPLPRGARGRVRTVVFLQKPGFWAGSGGVSDLNSYFC